MQNNSNIFENDKPALEKLANFRDKDILSASQFSREELDTILGMAAFYEKYLNDRNPLPDMQGRIMASLFFEPSTRTRLSFESAMHRLSGSVITVAESAKSQTSSTVKGETLYDAIRVVDGYADVIVIRSPVIGAANEAAGAAVNPVINAGDGAGEHPTQALLDLYTILKEKGTIDGLTITLLGDLKYGRTVHSLIKLLSLYDCNVVLVSPDELKMPGEIVTDVTKGGVKITEKEDLNEVVSGTDVLYVTRIQQERFDDKAEYERVKSKYIINGDTIESGKDGMSVMHPLPRVNEIETDVDKYQGAAYFRQAINGVPVRMALLALVTGRAL